MRMQTTLEETEQEDARFRGEIKRIAYEYESHGNPSLLLQELSRISEESKKRQWDILCRHEHLIR